MSQKRKTEQARRRGRILLVDRHALMRRAAASWINHCPGLEVCGMASGTAQAFRAVQRFHPDVVVSEIMQPHDLGFIRELHRRQPGLRILVFSMRDEAQYGAPARAAGAAGYVMKEAGGDNLVRNISSVLRGRRKGPAGAPKRG
jgi:DNA-binding NarL/FixJ family response regulator